MNHLGDCSNLLLGSRDRFWRCPLPKQGVHQGLGQLAVDLLQNLGYCPGSDNAPKLSDPLGQLRGAEGNWQVLGWCNG
jgi:hypothetical protein